MTELEVRTVLREELAHHVPPRLVSVAAAATALGIAETMCWQLVKTGDLRSIKLGRRRLIPVDALDEFVAQASSVPA